MDSMNVNTFPKQWQAEVLACLRPGTIRVNVCPIGPGQRAGLAEWDEMEIPIDVVPLELRTPNTLLWLEVDEKFAVVRAWKREPELLIEKKDTSGPWWARVLQQCRQWFRNWRAG
jgi:hypothetical protein